MSALLDQILPKVSNVSAGAAVEPMALNVNAHIHLPPNFSAFESRQQAISLAAEQKINVLGASNYYDYSQYDDFARASLEKGIFPIFGMEIIALDAQLVSEDIKVNDPGNPGKIYICGKGLTGFNNPTPRAAELLKRIRTADEQRIVEMIRLLSDVFTKKGYPVELTMDSIIDDVASRHSVPRETVVLQERHVCQAFEWALSKNASDPATALEKLTGVAYPGDPKDGVAIQGFIRSHLLKRGKPAFVDESFVTLHEATELIRELGGIPCYPTLADGTSPICPFEDPPEKLAETLKSYDIPMAEFIPLRNTPEVLSQYVHTLRKAGIAITAGTEHNTQDLVPIPPTCVKGAAIPKDVDLLFQEGARIVAAHQIEKLRQRPGFIESDIQDPEERIRHFAALGDQYLRNILQH